MTEPSRGEHLVDILITNAKSEYPHEWSKYCDLAQKLAQEINEKRANSQRRIVPGDGSAVMIAINMG
jgi:hypothetical protein